MSREKGLRPMNCVTKKNTKSNVDSVTPYKQRLPYPSAHMATINVRSKKSVLTELHQKNPPPHSQNRALLRISANQIGGYPAATAGLVYETFDAWSRFAISFDASPHKGPTCTRDTAPHYTTLTPQRAPERTGSPYSHHYLRLRTSQGPPGFH